MSFNNVTETSGKNVIFVLKKKMTSTLPGNWILQSKKSEKYFFLDEMRAFVNFKMIFH